MMEKYGAEIEKFDVVEVSATTPDDRKTVAKGLTVEEAMDFVEKDKNYMIVPAQ